MTWKVVDRESFDDDPASIEVVLIVAEEEFDDIGPTDPGGWVLRPIQEAA